MTQRWCAWYMMPRVFLCSQQVRVNILPDCMVMRPITSIYRTQLCRISLSLGFVIISQRLDQCFNYDSSSVSCCKLSSLALLLACRSHFPAGSVTCVWDLQWAVNPKATPIYVQSSQAPSAWRFKFVQDFTEPQTVIFNKQVNNQRQEFKLRS